MPWYVSPAGPATATALLTVLRPRATAVHVTGPGVLPAALASAGTGGGHGVVARVMARLQRGSGSSGARGVTLRTDDDAAWAVLLDHVAGTALDLEVVTDNRMVARIPAEGTAVADLTEDERAAVAAALGAGAVEHLPAPPVWYRLGRS